MAGIQQRPRRNYSINRPIGAGDRPNMASLFKQCKILEPFDDATRLRFGKMISAAVLKSAKRH